MPRKAREAGGISFERMLAQWINRKCEHELPKMQILGATYVGVIPYYSEYAVLR